ncbi:hypothetical protein [Paraliobacillus salinarum]|uniref:hypothetical protein n=1 Tax=Paraliobacillus salinarum TaxID=1158996 RepID=UPI0015F3DCDB|nr:hypothetical protein [Paraliobacillus salinarum]
MNNMYVNRTKRSNNEDEEIVYKEIENDRHTKNARATSMLEQDYPRINTDNL